MNTKPINPSPELAPQLKLLRLSGFLDSLESRNRQAIQGKLAYTEFLAMLVGDEVARREGKKFSMRLRRAQFRATKTLDQFDFDKILPMAMDERCLTSPSPGWCHTLADLVLSARTALGIGKVAGIGRWPRLPSGIGQRCP